jgi:hypothetical protein
VITLDRTERGSAVTTDGSLGAAREEFASTHTAVLRGLFGPRLLDWVHAEMRTAAFDQRDYDGLAGELTLDDTIPLVARLLFLVNDPALLAAVSEVTGIPALARFDGRIYRRRAQPDHYDNWHDDLAGEARRVAMSVNLGPEQYEGGRLELRRRNEPELIADVHNWRLGDALLFRIDPGLQHRVTSITTGEKTAFAGWFGTAPVWPNPVPVA